MQMAVIEAARNLAGHDTGDFERIWQKRSSCDRSYDRMAQRKSKGKTPTLKAILAVRCAYGAYPCDLKKDSMVARDLR